MGSFMSCITRSHLICNIHPIHMMIIIINENRNFQLFLWRIIKNFQNNSSICRFRSRSSSLAASRSIISVAEWMVDSAKTILLFCQTRQRTLSTGIAYMVPQGRDLEWCSTWLSLDFFLVFTTAILGIAEMFKYPDLSPTGSMVLNMVEKLPKISGIYCIYMDNYFTSIQLFQLPRKHGYGACGTTHKFINCNVGTRRVIFLWGIAKAGGQWFKLIPPFLLLKLFHWFW